jgi:hypothetical protein
MAMSEMDRKARQAVLAEALAEAVRQRALELAEAERSRLRARARRPAERGTSEGRTVIAAE